MMNENGYSEDVLVQHKKKIQAPVILLRPLLSSNLGWTVTFGLPRAPPEPWGQLAQVKQKPFLSG